MSRRSVGNVYKDILIDKNNTSLWYRRDNGRAVPVFVVPELLARDNIRDRLETVVGAVKEFGLTDADKTALAVADNKIA